MPYTALIAWVFRKAASALTKCPKFATRVAEFITEGAVQNKYGPWDAEKIGDLEKSPLNKFALSQTLLWVLGYLEPNLHRTFLREILWHTTSESALKEIF